MFGHHDSNQPGLHQDRNAQSGVANQYYDPNILMDLTQPLPHTTPPPALSIDNGPGGCMNVGNTSAALPCGSWNGVGAQLHPAHGTMATSWGPQPFGPVDTRSFPPRYLPAVDHNLERTLPHTTQGLSPSGQEGYLDPPFPVWMHSDPWSSEIALSNTRPASQAGYERACSRGSPPSVHTPSQGRSSMSEARSQCTPISSQETGTGRMGDSMMTMVANPPIERDHSDAMKTDYHSWCSGHGLDSSNDPQTSQNIGNSYMLDCFLETSRPDSPVSAQSSMYPENQILRFSGPMNSNTDAALIPPSTSPISRVSLTLLCEVCGNEYTGDYRKGNLARHQRQKHGIEEQVYRCEEPGCLKEFKRQDARLKHYRAHHPHRAPVPLISRT